MAKQAQTLEGDVQRVAQVDAELWRIGNNPDLGELSGGETQEVVDHAIFQSTDGNWHLWACIRGIQIGRLLYRWEGNTLEQSDWEPKGVAMRVDRSYGESVNPRGGEEKIQAPHVITRDGTFYMFYGGGATELGEGQICLATSKDGREFQRYKNQNGYSRLFAGPMAARDPMVIEAGGLYYCYYTGHDAGKPSPCKVYCRTSSDLSEWSDHREVCWGGSGGYGPWSAECPFVVFLDGYFYLLRTSRYTPPAETHVYRSKDPLDFGLDNDSKKIGTLRVAAPEVMQVGDQYYISTVEDLRGGVQLAKLKWVAS